LAENGQARTFDADATARAPPIIAANKPSIAHAFYGTIGVPDNAVARMALAWSP
jgi:hypothetical protein